MNRENQEGVPGEVLEASNDARKTVSKLQKAQNQVQKQK
jgi:hypothetical protein